MNLSKLLEKLSYTLVSGSVETQVESLTSDSRKVRENTAFVCIVGAVSDGHTYIQAAVEQKASVIVVQQGCKEEYLAQIPDTVTVVSVEMTRYALAFSQPHVLTIRQKSVYNRHYGDKGKDNDNLYDPQRAGSLRY